MDKVYIAYEHVPHEDTWTLGAFSTLAKAETYLAFYLFDAASKRFDCSINDSQQEFDNWVKYFVDGIPAAFGKPAMKFTEEEARKFAYDKVGFVDFQNCFKEYDEFYIRTMEVQ